jgi:branched-chain amino acid transport system permease protein
MRENETAAAMLGIAANRERAKALMLSSYLTGIAGALYVHIMGLVEPALVFNLHLSVLPLVFSIFGAACGVGADPGSVHLYPLEHLILCPAPYGPLLPLLDWISSDDFFSQGIPHGFHRFKSV